ncbi:MAG: glycosyltransferase family 25 protein [Alphaproteobacteria bacterium]|nr:glycosyltransferase family 25 protein [Alphaproteobacteria bacterium]
MWPHPIFVINLKTSADRRKAAEDQLLAQGLTPTFVEAVDGRRISDAEVAALVDFQGRLRRAPKPLNRAEIGCYLSHCAVLERIVAEDIAQALVMEDDLLATPELAPVLDAIATRTLPSYEMIKVGISELQTKPFTPIMALTAISSLVRRHNVVNSNMAYVITRAGAERFLTRARPIRYPVDVAMNRSWRHGMDILSVDPWPVGPNAAFRSTIGDERFAEAKHPGTLRQRLERRFRKGYDSLSKRIDIQARLKRDAAWKRTHGL